MAYSEDGRKSRSTNKKRVVKYKTSKGGNPDDEGTGSGLKTKSIKTKTKYDKKGEIKKIKRVKKTEGGGKMVTISKPGLENNSLSPEGATGLVTTRHRENIRLRKDLKSMAMAMGKVKNPPKKETYDVMGNPYTRTDTKKFGINSDTFVDFAMENAFTPNKKEVKKYKRQVRRGKI
tara:strand:- start:116 stop:643 length:528 start_codon:yes stop_codon:yes gene_type:complete